MKTSHKLAFGFLILCIVIVGFRIAAHNSRGSSGQTAVQSAAPGEFPGTGSEEDWHAARAVAHESANAFRAGNFDLAVQLGQQAISKYPNDADINVNTGLAFIRRSRPGDAEQGEALIKQALAIRPDCCAYWCNLSQALVAQNRLSEAREAMVKASECNPTPDQAQAIQQNISQLDAASQAPPAAAN